MGLRVSIYKRGGQSFAGAGGLSMSTDDATLVGRIDGEGRFTPAGGPFEVDLKAPAIMLVPALGRGGGWRAVPALMDDVGNWRPERRSNAVGPMMGGCYVGGDGRFGELAETFGPVPLHDRFETTAEYASNF